MGSQTESSMRVQLNLRVSMSGCRIPLVCLPLVNGKTAGFAEAKGAGCRARQCHAPNVFGTVDMEKVSR